MRQAVESGHLAGDGAFTKRCHDFFVERYGMRKPLLTTSCTDALELSALLLDIAPGDEVIAPSFAFVSTVNAFALRGAHIVFADSHADHPNLDAGKVEELITPRTKAVICVHYAGMACEMDTLVALTEKHNIALVEDAAHAVESTWKGRQLGTIGTFGAFSFHETKNIIAGEGGMLSVNADKFFSRAEILREKGTNRSAFFRGETDKYEWIDIGSSFLPSELTAAFLYAQLEQADRIQEKRVGLWNYYAEALKPVADAGHIQLSRIPVHASVNGHLFYLVCNSEESRSALLSALRAKGIHAVFHYQALHRSPYYRNKHDKRELPNADRYSDRLLRLPLFYALTTAEQDYIIAALFDHFGVAR